LRRQSEAGGPETSRPANGGIFGTGERRDRDLPGGRRTLHEPALSHRWHVGGRIVERSSKGCGSADQPKVSPLRRSRCNRNHIRLSTEKAERFTVRSWMPISRYLSKPSGTMT